MSTIRKRSNKVSIFAPIVLSVVAIAVFLKLRRESYYSPDGIRFLTHEDNDE